MFTTITEILQTGEDIERYGLWATYAVMRGYGQSRKRTLWVMWVATRTNAHRIKFRM
jgi:hypothetical protein